MLSDLSVSKEIAYVNRIGLYYRICIANQPSVGQTITSNAASVFCSKQTNKVLFVLQPKPTRAKHHNRKYTPHLFAQRRETAEYDDGVHTGYVLTYISHAIIMLCQRTICASCALTKHSTLVPRICVRNKTHTYPQTDTKPCAPSWQLGTSWRAVANMIL